MKLEELRRKFRARPEEPTRGDVTAAIVERPPPPKTFKSPFPKLDVVEARVPLVAAVPAFEAGRLPPFIAPKFEAQGWPVGSLVVEKWEQDRDIHEMREWIRFRVVDRSTGKRTGLEAYIDSISLEAVFLVPRIGPRPTTFVEASWNVSRSKISGSYAVTGVLFEKRGVFVEKIKSLGGRFSPRVTKETDYLVVGTERRSGGSTKEKQAIRYGVPRVTESSVQEAIEGSCLIEGGPFDGLVFGREGFVRHSRDLGWRVESFAKSSAGWPASTKATFLGVEPNQLAVRLDADGLSAEATFRAVGDFARRTIDAKVPRWAA